MSLAAWEISESRLVESWAPGKGSLWGSWRNGGKSGSRLQEKAVALKVVGSRFFPAPLQETWAQAPTSTGGTAHFNLAQIYTWNRAAVISNLQPRTEHCLGRGVVGGGWGCQSRLRWVLKKRLLPYAFPTNLLPLLRCSFTLPNAYSPQVHSSRTAQREVKAVNKLFTAGDSLCLTHPICFRRWDWIPHYVTQDQLFLFFLTKVWRTPNSSVLTLLAQLVGIMEATSQNLLC